MRQSFIVDHDHVGFGYMDLVRIFNAVFAAISHLDRERRAFEFCGFDYIACHDKGILRVHQGKANRSGTWIRPALRGADASQREAFYHHGDCGGLS